MRDLGFYEAMDRLVTVDVRGRGVVARLYEEAFAKAGGPLSLGAAKALKESVEPGSVVIVTTGFRVPPWFVQETDGPPGAASLARALSVALGALPVLLTEPEERSLRVVGAAAAAAGLTLMPLPRLLGAKERHAASVAGFPTDARRASEAAKELLDRLEPAAVVAVEKAGMNYKGEYHTMRGLNITRYHAKVERLVEEASRRGVLTVGVGDGGNEVGMGVIEHVVRKHVPYGDRCQCPCGGGIAAFSKVDALVVAAVSNWGAHAVAAALSRLTGKASALYEPRQELRALARIVDEGAVDSATGLAEESVDGVPRRVHAHVVEMLREMARG